MGMPKVVAEYKSQAKARIVAAAAVVLRRKGLLRGTMEDIAREIGVSKGALYLYFPTKTRLLAAVMGRYRDQFLEVAERRMQTGDIAQGLIDSFEGIFSGEFDPAIYHMLVMSASADPEVREAMRIDAREDRKAFIRWLRAFEADGRIPPQPDVGATADAVLLLMEGAFSASRRGGPEDGRRQLLRALRLVLGRPPSTRRKGAPRRRPTRRANA